MSFIKKASKSDLLNAIDLFENFLRGARPIDAAEKAGVTISVAKTRIRAIKTKLFYSLPEADKEHVYLGIDHLLRDRHKGWLIAAEKFRQELAAISDESAHVQ